MNDATTAIFKSIEKLNTKGKTLLFEYQRAEEELQWKMIQMGLGFDLKLGLTFPTRSHRNSNEVFSSSLLPHPQALKSVPGLYFHKMRLVLEELMEEEYRHSKEVIDDPKKHAKIAVDNLDRLMRDYACKRDKFNRFKTQTFVQFKYTTSTDEARELTHDESYFFQEVKAGKYPHIELIKTADAGEITSIGITSRFLGLTWFVHLITVANTESYMVHDRLTKVWSDVTGFSVIKKDDTEVDIIQSFML